MFTITARGFEKAVLILSHNEFEGTQRKITRYLRVVVDLRI
jgi:hypothetical protein